MILSNKTNALEVWLKQHDEIELAIYTLKALKHP